MNNSEGIVVRNLSMSYGDKVVLRGVSFDLPRGQTLAIIGRSGCGKTTLLKGVSALKEGDGGDILLGGRQIIAHGRALFEEWEIRRHVMMVGQTTSLLPWLSALRNIAIGLEVVQGMPRTQAESRAREFAGELGLSDALDQYPEQLSGGQAQRVQLARVAVMQPEFLLLDEITSGIDPQTIKEVIAALYRLRTLASGVDQTCVVVTHLLPFAYDFADRILFLHEGVSYEEGPAQAFAQQATQRETQQFIESSMVACGRLQQDDGGRGP